MSQRLDSWFHDTVSALAYSVALGQAGPGRDKLQPPWNDLTRFILEQHGRMPDFLRAPLMGVTLGFDLLACASNGHRFHHLPPRKRQKQIETWKKSGMSFKRDLVRYYESLATLALYSREDAGTSRPIQAGPVTGERVVTRPEGEMKAEIVVVGSGPGGAITACLLAEAGCDVLLVEEGEYLPLSSCRAFSTEEMVQKYRNGGQTVAMGANKISYVEGRCVGGGSEINSGLYHRTPPEILETWRREFQVEGLADEDLRPHFEACERDVSVSLLPGAAPAASLKLHEGATRLGWKSLEVPRWFRYAPGTTDAGNGKRQSMTETYVPRFLKSGGRLLTGARVQRIRLEGGKWLLEARQSAGMVRIAAEKLFVCGGAVQTPALLRRSGITRNIGDSLRLHPTIKVVAEFPEAVNAADMGVPVHQVKEFAPRISFGCSISTPPYLALALLEHPEAGREVHDRWQRMATYYAMITGEGRGTVRALPRFRDPLVRFGLTESDRRDLGEGLSKLCEALFAAGATRLYPGVTGSAALGQRDDLKKLPGVLPSGLASLMTIHLFSSCPMGEDQSKCAADSFGRVHGFKNLHLADASLLCTAPGVNPQGSIMALARRNALRFLEQRR